MFLDFFNRRDNLKIKRGLTLTALLLALALLPAVKAKAQSGIGTFDYEYKSNAQGKMKAEQNRGRKARMYWNASIRRWTVEVDYGSADSDGGFGSDGGANNDDSISDSPSSGRTIVYHYDYKSNAQGKVKAERARGKTARMFYDGSRRKWAVEVVENLSARAEDESETVITPSTRRKVNTSANIGSANLPNGATVSYFPDEQMAEEIRRAAIKQGDWTKMWYDENRRAWAVAIKVR